MFSFQGTVLWINSRFQFLTIKNWNPASIRENKWWAKVDSNHRPHDYQSCALTSWAIGPLVEMSGIEPLTPCLQGRCSPSWATPPWCFFQSFSIVFSFSFAWKNVVGLTRLELVTSRLSGVRSNQLSYRPIFESYGSLKTEQYFEISDVRPTRS